MKQLYDFQIDSVKEILENLPYTNIIFLAPTGYGKTLVSLEVYKRWREIWKEKKNVEKAYLYVCVPRRDLIGQWRREAKDMELSSVSLPDLRYTKRNLLMDILDQTDVLVSTPKAGVSFINKNCPQIWNLIALVVIDEVDVSSALDQDKTMDKFSFQYKINELYKPLYEIITKKKIKTLGISATIGRESREAIFIQKMYNASIIWKERNLDDIGIERIEVHDQTAEKILSYIRDKFFDITKDFKILKTRYRKLEKRRILHYIENIAYHMYQNIKDSLEKIIETDPEVIDTFHKLCQDFAYLQVYLKVRSCFPTEEILKTIKKFENEDLVEFPDALIDEIKNKKYFGKMEKIIELAKEAFENNKRYIFFSSYIMPLEAILKETKEIEIAELSNVPPELLYQHIFSGKTKSLSEIVSIYHGKRNDREEQLHAFQSGETKVLLTTISMAQRGFNLPSDMAFLIEPVKDLRLISQVKGRTRGGKISYIAYPNEMKLERLMYDLTHKILEVLKYA